MQQYAVTTEIGLGLKRAAMQLEIPIVAAVQLNRQPELRKEKHPLLSDFRDSGRLEEIADVALGLHRPGFYDEKLPDWGLGGQRPPQTFYRLWRTQSISPSTMYL
jgi:replicative DNA helicase